uniref:Uncharacterized protein n=1 Tax=Panagrolaimus davidi TaxID=227884 RepID=A0A914QD76_9BILA
MTDSEIEFKNRTGRKIRVQIDCDRSLIIKNTSASYDVKKAIGGCGHSISQNLEYDVFRIVDTSSAFSIIPDNEKTYFRLPNNGNFHAFLTVMTENEDDLFGSNYGNSGFGHVYVKNLSSKNVFVKIDADGIDLKKFTTRDSTYLNLKDVTANISKTTELQNIVYYRAKQGIGYTFLQKHAFAHFYLNSSNNQYYLSIDYEDENGNIVQYYCKHPDHLVEKYYFSTATPSIIIRDDKDGIKIQIDRTKRGILDGVASIMSAINYLKTVDHVIFPE